MFLSVSSFIFLLGMIVKAKEKKYSKVTKTAYVLFFILMIISTFGYSLFPLEGDKMVMTFNNCMHIVVTGLVVVLVLATMCLLSIGYLKKENFKSLGEITLFFTLIIFLSGALNPIGLSNDWNILGLTERLNIFSLQVFIFLLSYIYSFREPKKE